MTQQEAFEQQISPLMKQLHELCEMYEISYMAALCLTADGQDLSTVARQGYMAEGTVLPDELIFANAIIAGALVVTPDNRLVQTRPMREHHC